MIIKGYPTQEKLDASKQEVVTVQPIKNGQHGFDTVGNNTVAEVATDIIEAGSTTQIINATAHAAEAGDVIRFVAGSAAPREVSVVSVTANTITLTKAVPVAPTTGDTFAILRYFQETVSLAGSSFTQTAFIRDSINQIVTEDTGTPANNRPLPVKVHAEDGTAGSFGAGVVGTGVIRNTPASDSPHLLATRHETVTTPLVARLSDGTNFIGETAAAPLAGRLTDGTDFISSLAIAAAQTTAGTFTKSIATVGVTLGWDGVTHRELAVSTAGGLTLDARHEAVSTPLAGRISDGTTFIGSEAVAAAQKTVATSAATIASHSFNLGWDGTTHRELLLGTSGETRTAVLTASASFPARGRIAGTALTGAYANILTAAADIKTIFIFNTCDTTIFVSFDTGVTDHVELESAESMTIDFAANGAHLASGADIRIKHDGVVPTTGSIRISAVS
jgi:hypothetical protein